MEKRGGCRFCLELYSSCNRHLCNLLPAGRAGGARSSRWAGSLLRPWPLVFLPPRRGGVPDASTAAGGRPVTAAAFASPSLCCCLWRWRRAARRALAAISPPASTRRPQQLRPPLCLPAFARGPRHPVGAPARMAARPAAVQERTGEAVTAGQTSRQRPSSSRCLPTLPCLLKVAAARGVIAPYFLAHDAQD